MSLESGRKFGFYASLMNVILPIAAVVGYVAFFIALFASITSGIGSGTSPFTFPALFAGGLNIFLIAFGAVSIVAYVMFMYAMYSLSNYYKEPAIFKNVLYAFIISLITGVVAVAILVIGLLSAFAGFSPITSPSTVAPAFTQFIIVLAVVIIVAFAFGIVNGVLYMRAFNKLKEKSGVDNFGTAGLLYLIGVFITPIMWIAWLFAAMGFNKLKAVPLSPPSFSYPAQPPSTITQMKHCPNCGTENYGDASYCRTCGKILQ
jgi:uncharacterized membrane protein